MTAALQDRIDIEYTGQGRVTTVTLNGAEIRGPVRVGCGHVDTVMPIVLVHLHNVVVRHHHPVSKALWPWLVDWKRRVLG